MPPYKPPPKKPLLKPTVNTSRPSSGDKLERFPSYDVVDRENHSDLRWTVDTPEDFEMVTRVYDHLYPSNPVFGYRDVLKLVQAHPELTRINQHVEQKTVV